MRDGGGVLSEEQLEHLARYFDEEVIAPNKIQTHRLGSGSEACLARAAITR